MGSLRLVLGWEQLLEADQAALPAIRGLCTALEIRTHYHHPSQTLYIEPPVIGRQVTVTAATHDSDLFQTAAQSIALALQQRLEQGGAQIADPADSAALRKSDLVLHVSVGAIPEWGVSMAYNWLRCNQNRKLAGVLAEEVSWATGLENLGARVSLVAGTPTSGAPTIEVLIGQPPPNDIGYLKEHRFLDAVAEGVYTGLSRFWSNPTLEEIRQRHIPEPAPDPAPESAPMPDPVGLRPAAPITVVEVDPDPIIDLDPQPMIPAVPSRIPLLTEKEPSLSDYALLAAAPPPQPFVWPHPIPHESVSQQPLAEPPAPPPQQPPKPPGRSLHAFAWRQNRRMSAPKPLVITDQGGPVLKFP